MLAELLTKTGNPNVPYGGTGWRVLFRSARTGHLAVGRRGAEMDAETELECIAEVLGPAYRGKPSLGPMLKPRDPPQLKWAQMAKSGRWVPVKVFVNETASWEPISRDNAKTWLGRLPYFRGVDDEAVDLLEQIFIKDDLRITAEEALQHRFFIDFHDRNVSVGSLSTVPPPQALPWPGVTTLHATVSTA